MTGVNELSGCIATPVKGQFPRIRFELQFQPHGLFSSLCPFLDPMVPEEQQSHNNERQGYARNHAQANPHRTVHGVVMQKKPGARQNAYGQKGNPTCLRPFPAYEKEGSQNKGRDQVHQESQYLLSYAKLRVKGVQGEHAHKEDSNNAKNSGRPVYVFRITVHKF